MSRAIDAAAPQSASVDTHVEAGLVEQTPQPSGELGDLPRRGEQAPRGMRRPVEPTPPHEQAPPTGLGLLLSGVGATGMGTLFIVLGVIALQPEDVPVGGEGIMSDGPRPRLGLMLGGFGVGVGVLGASAGVMMLAIGGSRVHRYRQWARARPMVHRTAPGTWTAGFAIRF